ncbi:uncharacterized protein [Coffea arabica]|uniref:Endonuclease/exonuclease/phosphatase domain-containing protein n=1 Tax=Coffea arabica TaxID=13443 RepID=A0ABM4UFA2_COFAR
MGVRMPRSQDKAASYCSLSSGTLATGRRLFRRTPAWTGVACRLRVWTGVEGVEEGEIAEVYVELPIAAGSLSPRMNILADKPSFLPWCIGGDLNVVMAPHDKRGGRPVGVHEGVELMSFMEAAGVFDVGFSGANFTWCNNQRENAVRRAEVEVEGNEVELAQDGLERARADLSRALALEEQFWRQNAQVRWLQSGDRNSKFFHAVVKQRRVQSAIHRIKNSRGSWVEKDEEIAFEAITFFSDLFSEPTAPVQELMHLIPLLITEEDNKSLE